MEKRGVGFADGMCFMASLIQFSEDGVVEEPAALRAVSARLGFTPNLATMLAKEPDLLALLAPTISLDAPGLTPATQASVGVAIATEHASGYCSAMLAYLAAHAAKLSEEEVALNRNGASADARNDPLVRFAVRTVRAGGHVTQEDLILLRSAGLPASEIPILLATIVRAVSASLLANLLDPEPDFPSSAGT